MVYWRNCHQLSVIVALRHSLDHQLGADPPVWLRKEQGMKKLFTKFVSETDGQDLIEYALLASVIALGVTAAMMFVRDQLNTEFSNIGNSITAGS
jgi:Flp pilus assembly pilin Flp